MEREERLYVSRVLSVRPEYSDPPSLPLSTPQRLTVISSNTVPSTYNQSQLDFIDSDHSIESPDMSIHSTENEMQQMDYLQKSEKIDFQIDFKSFAPPPSPKITSQ